MNTLSTTDMLGAISWAKIHLELRKHKTDAPPLTFEGAKDIDSHLEAMDQLTHVVKRIRFFGGIDKVIAILDRELKAEQGVLFGYSEAQKTESKVNDLV